MHITRNNIPMRPWGFRLVLLAAVMASAAHASEGLYLLGNDAQQMGRADSGTASPRSAYWLFMNPASITGLDKRLDLSLYGVLEKVDMQPRGIIGNRFSGELNADGMLAMPGGGIIWPIDDGEKGVLGMATYVMGGGDIEYNESRTLLGKVLYGNRDRLLSLQHYQVALGYAYQLESGWALGAAAYGSIVRFRTNQLTLSLLPAKADGDWDMALGAGFSIGVHRNWDKWAVGAMYRSRQWMQRLGDYRDLLKHSLDYPHSFKAGVAYRPVEDLELTLDYEYQMWSKTPTFGGELTGTGLHWDDVHGIKAGIEWTVNDRWTLMAGYSFADTVVDDDHLFLNSLVPTLIEHHYAFGVTHHLNERHSIHASYLYSGENTLTDSGRGGFVSRLTSGSEVTVSGHSIALGYTYHF